MRADARKAALPGIVAWVGAAVLLAGCGGNPAPTLLGIWQIGGGTSFTCTCGTTGFGTDGGSARITTGTTAGSLLLNLGGGCMLTLKQDASGQMANLTGPQTCPVTMPDGSTGTETISQLTLATDMMGGVSSNGTAMGQSASQSCTFQISDTYTR